METPLWDPVLLAKTASSSKHDLNLTLAFWNGKCKVVDLSNFGFFRKKNYTIYYEVKYGERCSEWTENVQHQKFMAEQSFVFNYDISQRDQTIKVKVTVDMTDDQSKKRKNSESVD